MVQPLFSLAHTDLIDEKEPEGERLGEETALLRGLPGTWTRSGVIGGPWPVDILWDKRGGIVCHCWRL